MFDDQMFRSEVKLTVREIGKNVEDVTESRTRQTQQSPSHCSAHEAQRRTSFLPDYHPSPSPLNTRHPPPGRTQAGTAHGDVVDTSPIHTTQFRITPRALEACVETGGACREVSIDTVRRAPRQGVVVGRAPGIGCARAR